MPLIQLTTSKSIPDKHNIMQSYARGDWVDIGRHQARLWLANGTAQLPDHERARKIIAGDLDDCGIIALNIGDVKAITGKYQIAARYGDLSVPFKRTFLWGGNKILPVQVVMGFTRLEKTKAHGAYEVAAMLANNKTAAQVGSESDQAGTLELAGDLRLPIYDPGAVWMRRTETTLELVEAWMRELYAGVGAAHAFLRALYTTCPALCTLPPNWMYPWWEK